MLTSRAVISEKVLRSERRSAWLDVGTDGDRDPGFAGNHEERLYRDEGRKTQAGAGHHASDRQDGDDHTVLVIVVPESADPRRIRWIGARRDGERKRGERDHQEDQSASHTPMSTHHAAIVSIAGGGSLSPARPLRSA